MSTTAVTEQPTSLPGPRGTRFHTVHWFDSIDSTNRYLLDLAAGGGSDGIVAVADVQTAGRGRLDRRWQAPVGASLLVSALVRPNIAVDCWPQLLGAAGLSAVASLTTLCDLPARLKWPNDVVVGDRKIAGLLAETTNNAIVVGMGLNIDWQSLPPDIAETATAVSLVGGRIQPRRMLLESWLRGFDSRLQRLERTADAFQRMQHAQRINSATLGRRVRVERSNEMIVGVAVDLGPDGSIVVRSDDGVLRTLTTGDVVHLRTIAD